MKKTALVSLLIALLGIFLGMAIMAVSLILL